MTATQRFGFMSTPVSGIRRIPAPADTVGIRAQTSKFLGLSLTRVARGRRLIASDLSLGAWQHHHLASELQSQLGIDSASKGEFASVDQLGTSYPDLTAIVQAGIDAESLGNVIVEQALGNATDILDGLKKAGEPTLIGVILPLENRWFDQEDDEFLWFLANGLRDTEHQLAIISYADRIPDPPNHWHVRWHEEGPTTNAGPELGFSIAQLVPGILTRQIIDLLKLPADQINELSLELPDGSRMAGPEMRSAGGHESRIYDSLAETSKTIPWLYEYANFFGSNYFLDIDVIRESARRAFASGRVNHALRLMSRAIESAQEPNQRAILEIQAQGMRIAALKFEEAASYDDSAGHVVGELRGWLRFLKGWGAAAGGDSTVGYNHLNEAEPLLKLEEDGLGYLYFCNIKALALARQGDMQAAVALERSIQSRLTGRSRVEWRLTYLNALNTGRLYRSMGRLDDAKSYMERAFQVTIGTRSLSDAMLANITLGGVKDRRSTPRSELLYWVRVALHWAGALNPECISGRVALAVLGHPPPAHTAALVEQVSSTLCKRLIKAMAATTNAGCGDQTQASDFSEEPPVFAPYRVAEAAWSPGLRAVGGDGWGVFTSPISYPSYIDGPERTALRSTILWVLTHLGGRPEEFQDRTILVHDMFGGEIPSDRLELLSVAIPAGSETVVFDGRELALNESVRRDLAQNLYVKLGPGVAEISGSASEPTVIFKRSYPPRGLSPSERAIVDAAESGARIEQVLDLSGHGGDSSGPYQILNSLAEARVITFELQEL